jgi:hypothetical protein
MSGETTVILGERTFEEISQNRTALLEPGESSRTRSPRA